MSVIRHDEEFLDGYSLKVSNPVGDSIVVMVVEESLDDQGDRPQPFSA